MKQYIQKLFPRIKNHPLPPGEGWGEGRHTFVVSDTYPQSRHTGECDPQDVGNVARGHDVRSDQYPVNIMVYLMLACTNMTAKILNLSFIVLIPTILLIALIFCLSIPNAFAEDDLGRLFTTPQQRNVLEKLRHQKPVEEIKAPEIIFEEPVVEAEAKPVIGGITVNGLVYRKGGKSTAWVNNANTFEGNFGNQYIQIDAQNIKPDDVEILIPINQTTVKLKAGETYNPEMDEVISPGYQDN